MSAIDEFCTALTEMSRRYGFTISGCGCCESPRINRMTPEQESTRYQSYYKFDGGYDGENLTWEEP